MTGAKSRLVGRDAFALRVSSGTWRKMDPAKLYSISEHKYDIAKQVIRAGGKPILKECHAGARKRTNDAIKAARKK